MPKHTFNNDPERERHKTNVELLTEYMEFGSPLRQAFVIEAVSRYAKEVMENQNKLLTGMKHSPVNPHAWIACAADWQKALKDEGRPT